MFDAPVAPVYLAAVFLIHPHLGFIVTGTGIALLIVAAVNQRMTAVPFGRANAFATRSNLQADAMARNAQVLNAMEGRQIAVPVRFVVQPDGRVSEARSTGSAPRRVANAAVRAVQQWRFDPLPAAREIDVELLFKPGEE